MHVMRRSTRAEHYVHVTRLVSFALNRFTSRKEVSDTRYIGSSFQSFCHGKMVWPRSLYRPCSEEKTLSLLEKQARGSRQHPVTYCHTMMELLVMVLPYYCCYCGTVLQWIIKFIKDRQILGIVQ